MFELGLKGKIAIITGGSDGLGRATAERLAGEGAKVVICARREEHLQLAAKDIAEQTGAELLGVRADVSIARVAKCVGYVHAVSAASFISSPSRPWGSAMVGFNFLVHRV